MICSRLRRDLFVHVSTFVTVRSAHAGKGNTVEAAYSPPRYGTLRDYTDTVISHAV